MMLITQIFILITLAVIFSTSTTIQAGRTMNQCETSEECATWWRCIHGSCGNPCEYADQGGRAICTVENHNAEFTCTSGHEFPSGSNIKLCLPIEWKCRGDEKKSDSIICNSPSWICLDTNTGIQCGNKKKILERATARLTSL